MTAGRRAVGQRCDWGTPSKYVAAVREFFGGIIDLDPCSNQHSIVGAAVEYTLPHDGLTESWDFRRIFVNPPYGRDRERGTGIGDWLARCAAATESDVLALVPVATNTGHWKKYVYGKAAAICFLSDTRLRFLVDGRDEGVGAPMACAMIYWGTKRRTFSKVFKSFGEVVRLEPLEDARR